MKILHFINDKQKNVVPLVCIYIKLLNIRYKVNTSYYITSVWTSLNTMTFMMKTKTTMTILLTTRTTIKIRMLTRTTLTRPKVWREQVLKISRLGQLWPVWTSMNTITILMTTRTTMTILLTTRTPLTIRMLTRTTLTSELKMQLSFVAMKCVMF